MILVVKHRFAYYKRFELDVWGVGRSILSRYNLKLLDNNLSRKKRFINWLQKDYRKSNKKGKITLHKLLKIKPLAYKKRYNRIKIDFNKKVLFKSKFVSKICSFFFKLFLDRQEYRSWRKKRYVYRIDVIKPFKKKHFYKKKFISLRLVKLFYLTLSYKAFRKIYIKARKQDGLFESNFLYLLEGRIIPIVYRSGLANNMFEILSFVRTAQVYVNKTYFNNLNFSIKIYDLVSFSASLSRYLYLGLLYRLLRRRAKSILFNHSKFLFVSYKLMCFFIKRHPKEKELVFPVGIDIYRATGILN